jgi:hypothetical protein
MGARANSVYGSRAVLGSSPMASLRAKGDGKKPAAGAKKDAKPAADKKAAEKAPEKATEAGGKPPPPVAGGAKPAAPGAKAAAGAKPAAGAAKPGAAAPAATAVKAGSPSVLSTFWICSCKCHSCFMLISLSLLAYISSVAKGGDDEGEEVVVKQKRLIEMWYDNGEYVEDVKALREQAKADGLYVRSEKRAKKFRAASSTCSSPLLSCAHA